jgi:NAD(P)-dependent dehydrogenase (short-subunit alcohol dehydrogenase family)
MTNRTALITGASRGIGRGIALELAAAGYDLLIHYASQQQAAQETALACEHTAATNHRAIRTQLCRANLANADDRSRLVREARAFFGHLDLLVNNAGVAPESRVDVLETGEASLDRLLAINLKGPYFLTQLAAKWMIETATQQPQRPPPATRSKIVMISSISAYTASTQRGEYCVSKAALSMLTTLFAARLAEFGIAVHEIRPGIIATDMTAPVRDKYDRLIHDGLTPIRRWGTPADIGKAVLAIASDLLPFSTGNVIDVDGGFHLRRL